MKTVIEMAEKAFETPGTEPAFRNVFWTMTQDELGRFTELVRADEREACAKVCDDLPAPERMSLDNEALYECATRDCAGAIRARSNT